MHRLLHVMLRVGDLARAERFYCEALGMRVVRKVERPEQGYSLSFLGYGPEESTTVIELTHNHGVRSYDLGDAYGHIALAVTDVSAACRRVHDLGGVVVREPGPVVGGVERIAFVLDPEGYKIEFIEGM